MNYNILYKDIVKYLIVIGIIYTILKLMPSQKLSNKDIMLLLLIIIIIFVTIDYKCFKNNIESFVDTSKPTVSQPTIAQPTIAQPTTAQQKELEDKYKELLNLYDFVKKTSEPRTQGSTVTNTQGSTVTNTQGSNVTNTQGSTVTNTQESTIPIMPAMATGCSLEIDKIKQDMQNQINALKNELIHNNINTNTNVGQKYFDSLMIELKNNNIITDSDIQNIKNKISLKLLTLEEVIVSLEELKKTKMEVQPLTDLKYNELPSGFFTPIGDKIANDWDNDYNILDTTKWTVPMPRPPVCINNSPCKVCPSNTSDTLNLKDWDNSRIISNTSINKKWINNQTN